jgi:aryl-alcohol dehydrogenase-like predicted oxidoreductase
LALSYVLSYPGVSTVIPGIRTPEQVDLNTTGLFVLSSEDKMLIEQTDTSALLQLIIKQG